MSDLAGRAMAWLSMHWALENLAEKRDSRHAGPTQ